MIEVLMDWEKRVKLE